MLYEFPRPLPVVLCCDMSVVVVVRQPDGVVLCADRAAVQLGANRELCTAPDRQKLFAAPGRCAVAVAGVAMVTGGTPDLVDGCRDIASDTQHASEAAVRIMRLFDLHAEQVRACPGAHPHPVPPIDDPCFTVAIVAAADDHPEAGGVADAYLIGLAKTGRARLHRLSDGPGVAVAPVAGRTSLDRAVQRASRLDRSGASSHVGKAIRDLATTPPALGLVSLDWDHVEVGATGPGRVIHHTYSQTPTPRGS